MPTISTLERHPFTILSAPSAPERTLHIKALDSSKPGNPTFTARLAELVDQGGVEALGDVRIDAPYGSAGELAQCLGVPLKELGGMVEDSNEQLEKNTLLYPVSKVWPMGLGII